MVIARSVSVLLTWLVSDHHEAPLQEGSHKEEDRAHAKHNGYRECIDL